MTIQAAIDSLRKDQHCKFSGPAGLPMLDDSNLSLPADLAIFYEQCGGVEIYGDQAYGFRIVSPSEFVPANPMLLGRFYQEHKAEIDADQSSAWFIIAQAVRSPIEYITVDLNKTKSGYCYDSFWDVYATGNSKVLARSFTELIVSLHQAKGANLFWNNPGFNLGCAYD